MFGEDIFHFSFRGGRIGTFDCFDCEISGSFDFDQRTATLRLPTGDKVQLALSGFGSRGRWNMRGQSGNTYVELNLKEPSDQPSAARSELQPFGKCPPYVV
jgi:hypothetical protein